MIKGAILYKKHHNINQNQMMDGIKERICGNRFIDLNDDIEIIEKKLDLLDVDFLIAWYYKEDLIKLKPLKRLGIPIIMTSDDPWGRLFSEDYKNIVDYHDVNGVILQTKNTELAFRKYLNKKINFFWLPWGINPNIMKDYKEEKIWDISISGKFSSYEWRRKLNSILYNYKRYHRIPRILPPDRSWEDYARDLNKSRISLGGCHQSTDKLYYKNIFIGETFSKTLEIPACNTCLINTNFADKELLGFKDGENFIEFNSIQEFKKKIKFYLKNIEELERITQNGYDLVHKNYTINQQVDRLKKEIIDIYG